MAVTSYQLVTQVGQTNQILLDIQSQTGAALWYQAQQLLHLLLGDELLMLQVVGEAGEEADPAGGVGPEVRIFPIVLRSDQLTVQLPDIDTVFLSSPVIRSNLNF